jgi:phospholipid transport system substrate-binding protein
MQHRSIKVLFCVLTLSVGLFTQAVAQPAVSAEQLVRDVSTGLLEGLEEHQGQWGKHQVKLESVVEQIVMPHVDLSYMAKKVVGRSHWSRADPATQAKFVQAFKTSVIRTYSRIFSHYDGEVVKVYPLPQPELRKDRVQVGMSIAQQAGRPAVIVRYDLLQRDSVWLVYDFNVEDVGVLSNYQAQYLDTLQSSGLAGLVDKIEHKNKEFAP